MVMLSLCKELGQMKPDSEVQIGVVTFCNFDEDVKNEIEIDDVYNWNTMKFNTIRIFIQNHQAWYVLPPLLAMYCCSMEYVISYKIKSNLCGGKTTCCNI